MKYSTNSTSVDDKLLQIYARVHHIKFIALAFYLKKQ